MHGLVNIHFYLPSGKLYAWLQSFASKNPPRTISLQVSNKGFFCLVFLVHTQQESEEKRVNKRGGRGANGQREVNRLGLCLSLGVERGHGH